MFGYQARAVLLKRLSDAQRSQLLVTEGRLGRNLQGWEINAIFGNLMNEPKAVNVYRKKDEEYDGF